MDDDRRDSATSNCSTPRLSRTDSLMSIGSFRPSLVWLYDHIRPDDKESLVKDDLKPLLGADVDSTQLDEAFDNLDIDGDGQISLDEFIGGFTKFWKDAPHKPDKFPSLPTSKVVHYESEQAQNPSEKLQDCLSVLSSHNRSSIENLWTNLNESNPDLLPDFEEFVSELASEIQTAQRALTTQRQAIKREAVELDQEIESRLSDAQTTLHIQTNLVKQQVRAKLQNQLSDKEGELMMVRSQLDELEDEVIATQERHTELQQQVTYLNQEKVELSERLEVSEQRLLESQSTVATIQSRALTDVEEQQQDLYYHEEELLKQKSEYEKSIAKLKEQLEQYKQTPAIEAKQATPDLLVTTIPTRPRSGGSLRDEIAEKDGYCSPLIRHEAALEPSPFRNRTRSFMKKPRSNKSLKEQNTLTMSLPNIADIDNIDSLSSTKQLVYVPVYVNGEGRQQQGPPPPPVISQPSLPDPSPDNKSSHPNKSPPIKPPRKRALENISDQHPLHTYSHIKDERCMVCWLVCMEYSVVCFLCGAEVTPEVN